MKRYTKDGAVKYRNEIVIKKDGRQIINPTEAMLLDAGWVEWVKPTPPQKTEAELLEDAIAQKKQEIEDYDQSNEVNEFTISGFAVWLDKATRAGLMLRFQSEEALGKDVTTLWYNNQYFELPLSTAKAMLYQIEAYASECYDNTQKHLAQVARLTTIEEVEAYDYKTGYPDKLAF